MSALDPGTRLFFGIGRCLRRGVLAAVFLGLWLTAPLPVHAEAEDAPPPPSSLSIRKGFDALWRQTGLYRLFRPQTDAERTAEKQIAAVRAAESEIAGGAFDRAEHFLAKAQKLGAAETDRVALELRLATERQWRSDSPVGPIPEGLGQFLMMAVGLGLIYLAIAKKFEPLLLLPIGFGAILTNIPSAGIAELGLPGQPAGFLYYFYHMGVATGVFPLLIFLGIGAMTDFGPLLANPKTALLGAAAQFGIFFALLGALAMGGWFTLQDAASIGIIGGADGPTAIFLSSRLSPHLLGPIAVAAYSYMALVPIIQPPIMRLLTTPAERAIEMKQLRHVSRVEKTVFPLSVLFLCILLLPSATPLIGMLMLGNLMKESGVVERLSDTAQNALINIVTILLGLAVGSRLAASYFLNLRTLGIVALGLVAFMVGTAAGILLAKIMNLYSREPINPLIGSAGVSAVPMAARVANQVGLEANPRNVLLMHAMGPNVAGVIGSAVAAGVLLALCGV